MYRFAFTLIILAAVAPRLCADTILYDSNGFESPVFSTTAGTPSGNLNGQDGWYVITLSPSTSAPFSVESTLTASGSQAIQATGGTAHDSSFAYPAFPANPYPPEFYIPADNERIHIEADIARSAPSIATSASPVFAIDVYDPSQTRTTRFGLSSGSTGVIQPFVSAPYNGSSFDPNGSVQVVPLGSSVAPNTFVHFDALLDYADKTLSLTINGTNYGTAIPFADPDASILAAATFEIGTFNNSTDSGYLDNYRVSVESVPEPATAALCAAAIGAAAVLRFRSKRKLRKTDD